MQKGRNVCEYLQTGLKFTVRLYADDCALHYPVKCFHDIAVLQSDLQKNSSWCVGWQMNLNIAKCLHVQFTNNNKKKVTLSSSYVFESRLLEMTDHVGYICIALTSAWDWTCHIDWIAAKETKLLHSFSRKFQTCTEKVKRNLVFHEH